MNQSFTVVRLFFVTPANVPCSSRKLKASFMRWTGLGLRPAGADARPSRDWDSRPGLPPSQDCVAAGFEADFDPASGPVPAVRSRQRNPGSAVPAVRSRQCGPGSAVPAVRSRQCGPGSAVPAVRSRQCGPGSAVPAARSRQSRPDIPVPTSRFRQARGLQSGPQPPRQIRPVARSRRTGPGSPAGAAGSSGGPNVYRTGRAGWWGPGGRPPAGWRW